MDGYSDKSQSPGKHQARRFGYSHLTSAQALGFHIVIVGWSKKDRRFQCDDIPHLLDRGIPTNRIIACGLGCELECALDKHCNNCGIGMGSPAEWAMRTYGVIPSPHAHIENTVKWANAQCRLGSINVDLCASLVEATPILKRVMDIAPRCLVLFTFRRGRDSRIVGGFKTDYRDYIRRLHVGLAIDRANNGWFNYQSSTSMSNGSPMTVVAFKPQYRCRTCKQYGEHPSSHICSMK